MFCVPCYIEALLTTTFHSWGESAGGSSVGFHLYAYNGRNDHLFRAAIMQSGNPGHKESFRDLQYYQPLYDNLTQQAGCAKETDTLKCMRQVPYEQIKELVADPTFGDKFQPSVDGDFIARWPSEQLEEGAFVKVPIISGSTTSEGTYYGPHGPPNSVDLNSDADFARGISSNQTRGYLPERLVPEVLDVYPNTTDYFIPPVTDDFPEDTITPGGNMYRRGSAYGGDVSIVANRRGACEAWTKFGMPVYSFRFDTVPAGQDWYYGATHYSDVAFVLENTNGTGLAINPFANRTQSYFDLAELMSKTWASFIHDSNPNFKKDRYAQAAQWPLYSLENPQNIVWAANKTELAYVEPDTYRSEGIRWILDHARDYKR